MRLIFIPGFGEDETIFDKVHPYLPGEKLFLNNWTLLGNESRPELTALQYARELIEKYNITSEDVVIGHSMGGWIAVHIKHLVQCPAIQVSSWTDHRKISRFIIHRTIIYWLAKRGLLLNKRLRPVLIRKYRGKPSFGIYCSVIDNLLNGDKNCVLNQLRVTLNPVEDNIKVSPDLRIHARADTIIRFPDEPASEVPGDHFSLYTYPEKVYPPILLFLEEKILQ